MISDVADFGGFAVIAKPLDRNAGPAGINHARGRHLLPPDRAKPWHVAQVRFRIERVIIGPLTILGANIKTLAANINETWEFELS